MPYSNIREEEIKNKVAKDWFASFDCTQIIGNIDFSKESEFISIEALNVFQASKLLWQFYHQNVNDKKFADFYKNSLKNTAS